MSTMSRQEYLEHYGILRKSGRYPWGSGGNVEKRSQDFLGMVKELRAQGLSDTEICRGFSSDSHKFTTTDLRAATSIASNELRQGKINQAVKLKERGWSPTEIGKRMGVNESTVRGYLSAYEKDQADSVQSTAAMLMREVEKKGVIDVGVGVEHSLPLGGDMDPNIGITNTKLKTAVAIATEHGYKTHRVPVPQLGSPGNFTRVRVLAKPDIEWKDIVKDPGMIKTINPHTKDNGRTWQDEVWQPPIHVNSKRVKINYAEDGGDKADGVIYLRREAKDLHMGSNNYSQVRISVDGTHYLKGMAVYKDDMPPGVDLLFNTNKSKVGNTMMDVLKKQTDDPDLPFGAVVRQLKGEDGKVNSALNLVNHEGEWDKWSKNLPAQMLSKQKPEVAKGQLDLTYDRRRKELDSIMELTNPVVKKTLLEKFADGTDSAAVHLQAANMPRQATKVILPIPSMKPNEVYAPSFNNGERVALVRFPHGGTFEIPQLVVNNKNRDARKTMGSAAKDAIGIHHTVAERLSGADFDGDTVLVIPNPGGAVKSTPPLEGLKKFDPRAQYKAYDGMKTVDGGTWNDKRKEIDFHGKPPNKSNMQMKMGDISNLITDMTLKGAGDDELTRAVKHSMVVIDCEKHVLDYKASHRDNGIPALKEKYQGKKDAGASTIISKSRSPKYIDARRLRRASEGGAIDPETGRKVYVPKEGATYTNKKGEVVTRKQRVKLLEITDDARELSSGIRMEELYADHSNKLKALANEARKESLRVPKMKADPNAKKVYATEVASLTSKLLRAEKNAPLERQAQALANSVVAQKKAMNPHLEKADEKKIKNQALATMRVRTGARKKRIDITQAEWDAIQAGAISTDKLEKILANAELDDVRRLATPRPTKTMSSVKMQRAQQMLADGFTQAEVAEAIGVGLSTLKVALYNE